MDKGVTFRHGETVYLDDGEILFDGAAGRHSRGMMEGGWWMVGHNLDGWITGWVD